MLNALQNKARTGQAVAMFRDLFTDQGLSMEQARNQAIVQHSPHFDDTATPPDSLRALGITGYPEKASDIDFAAAERKLFAQTVSGQPPPEHFETLWLDFEQFQNDVSRREQM